MPSILQGLTDQPNQQYPITLPDGSTVTLDLSFWPQQLGWFADVSWDGRTPPWTLSGQQLVTSPNWLRQWRHVIPFGLSVATADALDPTSQEDFVNGNCALLLLNPSDVATVEADFFVGLPGP